MDGKGIFRLTLDDGKVYVTGQEIIDDFWEEFAHKDRFLHITTATLGMNVAIAKDHIKYVEQLHA